MSADNHVCATCGALVDNDWVAEHSEFHQEIATLASSVLRLQREVSPLLAAHGGGGTEVGFRGPAYDEPI